MFSTFVNVHHRDNVMLSNLTAFHGQGGQQQANQQQVQQQPQPQQSQTQQPPPPLNGQDLNLSNILHFLQSEWRRYERERNEWEIERAEMRVSKYYIHDSALHVSRFAFTHVY